MNYTKSKILKLKKKKKKQRREEALRRLGMLPGRRQTSEKLRAVREASTALGSISRGPASSLSYLMSHWAPSFHFQEGSRNYPQKTVRSSKALQTSCTETQLLSEPQVPSQLSASSFLSVLLQDCDSLMFSHQVFP